MNAGEAPRLAAAYFDGRTSARHDVTLTLDGPGLLRVSGSGVERIEPMSAIAVSEPLGGAPRRFNFADGAHCEVPLQPGLDAFLAAAGHADSVVVQAQSRWTWAIASAIVLVVALVAGYQYGLPWAARELAERIPPPLVAALSEQTLDFLERVALEPSRLPGERRDRIAEKFRAMKPPNGIAVPHAVLFRAAPGIGANALALPSGTIVVTDELVELTEDDGEILGVLAHELGHVQERHGLRLMVESSIVGFALAWYIGDVSSIAAGVPAALLQARYSREHERSADAYAARMLEANKMSPALLASMLEKLEASHRAGADTSDEDEALDYLSSHPATRERIEALRAR